MCYNARMSNVAHIPEIPKGKGVSAWKAYFWFLRYTYATSRMQAVILFAVLLFVPVTSAGSIWIVKRLVDAISSGRFAEAQSLFLVMSGLFLIQVINDRARDYVRDRSRLTLDYRTKEDLMLRLQKLDPAMVEHPRFQALYHAFEDVRGNLLSTAQEGFWIAFMAVELMSYATVLAFLPWWLALLMLIPLAFLFISLRHEREWSWGILNMESREGRRGMYYKQVLLSPGWLLHRWVLGLHLLFFRRWKQIATKALELRKHESWLRVRSNAISDLVMLIGLLGGGWFLFRQALSTGEVGTFVVFIPAFQRLTRSFTNVVSNVGWLQKQLVGPELFRLLMGLPARQEGVRHLPRQPLQIVFDQVTFAYPDQAKPVLKGVSLRLREGEYVALVGLNGAGKSTFLKLLAGIYRPTSGRVLVNGVPIENLHSDEWVKTLAYMNQDAPSFDDTVQNIIRYGNPAAPWGARAKQVLRVSGFEEMAKGFAKGVRTHIGRSFGMPEDKPIELSGGQRQLLMIAQTLYRKARILILDEPTSAVDAEKEEAFFSRLPEAIEGRLAVVVSHRFSVLRRAERILVMDDGKIIEDGSHDELVAKQGRYAELFALQAKMYQ